MQYSFSILNKVHYVPKLLQPYLFKKIFLIKKPKLLLFRHLLVNPRDRRVVVIESVLCPSHFRETLTRVLFKYFEVPVLYVVFGRYLKLKLKVLIYFLHCLYYTVHLRNQMTEYKAKVPETYFLCIVISCIISISSTNQINEDFLLIY